MSKRVGCMLVTDLFLLHVTDDRDGMAARMWAELMAKSVILRAEHLSFRAATVYHLRCDLFEPVADDCEPPQYTIEVSKCDGEILEWRAVKCEINGSPKPPALGAG